MARKPDLPLMRDAWHDPGDEAMAMLSASCLLAQRAYGALGKMPETEMNNRLSKIVLTFVDECKAWELELAARAARKALGPEDA
jgi:hypothetical protein